MNSDAVKGTKIYDCFAIMGVPGGFG